MSMETAKYDPGPARPATRLSAASFGQASLWFVRQLMSYKAAYNTAVQFRLSGDLDAGAALAGLREIAHRHESFRTTFALVEGSVFQVIHEELAADVATVDLAGSPDPELSARRRAEALAAQPFDLDKGPLLRAHLLRLAPREHVLVVVMDHIVADGMSLAILWRELSALYRAPGSLPPPAKQFAACVAEQSQWQKTPAFAKHLKYWTDHLAGATAIELPADRPRPPIRSYRGDLAVTRFPAPLTARLRALAEQEQVSLFATLVAGLDVLLARSSGRQDVPLMIPIACRQRFGADQVVGFIANMVDLRS
jgi:hypothetical protein